MQILRLPPLADNKPETLSRHVVELNKRLDTIAQALEEASTKLTLKGDLDAGGFRIKNIGTAQSENDSISPVQLQDAMDRLDDEFLASVTSEGDEEGVGGPGRLFRRGTSRFRRQTDDAIMGALADALPTAAPPNVAAVSDIGTTFDPPHFSLQDHTHGGVIGSPPAGGVAGQVAFFTSSFTIGGDAEFTYDSTLNILTVPEIHGSATPGQRLDLFGDGTADGVHISTTALGDERMIVGQNIDPTEFFVAGGLLQFLVAPASDTARFGAACAGPVEDNGPTFFGIRSQGTLAAPTATLDNNVLLQFLGIAYDANDEPVAGGAILALEQDAPTQTGYFAGRFTFFTTDAAGNAGLRLIIKNDGKIGINTVDPTTTLNALLTVQDGNVALTNTSAAGEVRFFEPSAGGTQYTSFKAQAQAATIDYTLPPAIVAGGALTTDAGGSLTWVVGAAGTVTSVAGGVGITNTPEPITTTGTVDLDINSLTTETVLAAGDLFPFVDVSVGTAPADQRKVTFADIAAAVGAAGGFVTGAGVAGRIAFWTGASTIDDDAQLLWDSTTNTLTVTGDATITGKLTVGGAIDPTMVLLTGADKRFGATDAGPVYLAPFTDAITGVQVRKANNTTVVLDVDTTNGFLGINTAAPAGGLDMQAATQAGATFIATLAPTSSILGSRLQLRAGNGTIAVPTALVSTDVIGLIQFRGFGTSYQRSSEIRCIATETFSATATGSFLDFATTPNTTATPVVALKLDQNADVLSQVTKVGATRLLSFTNPDNTNTTSHATAQVAVGGASAGDPSLNLQITGIQNWAIGIDNSDSDKLKVSRSSVVGADDTLIIDTAGLVGIGIAAPTGMLHVSSDSVNAVLATDGYMAAGAAHRFRQANGTQASPTATAITNTLGSLNFTGRGATTALDNATKAKITASALENWTDTVSGTSLAFEVTPVGSITRATRAILSSVGLGLGASITATEVLDVSGNIQLKAVGNKFRVKEGTNASMGVATMVAGTVVVNNTLVTATSRIFLTINTPGGTPSAVWVSARTAGTSFTITSLLAGDTSTVAWLLIEPAP